MFIEPIRLFGTRIAAALPEFSPTEPELENETEIVREPRRERSSAGDFTVSDADRQAALDLAGERVAEACGTDPVDPIVTGDLIALRFFERGSVPIDGPEAPAQSVAFERLDLGGSVAVGADGTAAIPALGRVALAGRAPGCAEAIVEREAGEVIGFNGRVTMAFAARPAVLVDGAVARPGSYPHTPTMTVGRVLAEAGSPLTRSIADPAERAATRARREELEATAAGLTLELARFNALLSGSRELFPQAGQARLVSQHLGLDAIERERALLAAWLDERAARATLAENSLADLRSRIDMLAAKLQSVTALRDYAMERNDRLGRLRTAGSVTADKLDEAKLAVLANDRDVLDAEQNLARAREELDRAAREIALADALALRDIRTATRNKEIELRGVERQIDALVDRPAGAIPRDVYTFVIARPGPDGTETFEARMDTRLMPGDMLTVSPAASAPELDWLGLSQAGGGPREADG